MMTKSTILLPFLLAAMTTAADPAQQGNKGLRGLKKEESTIEDNTMNTIIDDQILIRESPEELLDDDLDFYLDGEDYSDMEEDDDDEFNNFFGEAIEVIDPASPEDEAYWLDENGGEDNDDERKLSGWCYDFFPGAIRTSKHHNNAHGQKGKHYNLYHGKSHSWCKSSCSSNSWCKAYEYNHHKKSCELWKGWYGYYEKHNSFKSYVKRRC